jgi:serine/threonine protein kinase
MNKKNIINPSFNLHKYIQDELENTKRLFSKYIVKTYGIIETPKNVFIVMEYMKLNSLICHIQNLDMNDIWRYFRNLICAIEYCK